jgi:protein phosphatase
MNHHAFHWISTHITHTGLVRSINEDACLDLPEQGIWVVADGMGGHAAGDLASQMIIEQLKTIQPASSIGALENQTEVKIQEVNQRLRHESSRRGGEIIGSTVAALLAYERYCIYLWAGDSRIYLYRRGVLKQLSRDHSQLQELVEQGLISAKQAEFHPAANYITRAVGADDELELDAEIMEPCDNDIFLLCSDGLNKELSDAEIAHNLEAYPLHEAIEQMLALTLERGAHDNTTIVIAKAESHKAGSRQES